MFAFLGGYADRLRSIRSSIDQLIDCEGSSAGTPSRIDLRLRNPIADALWSRRLARRGGPRKYPALLRAVTAPFMMIVWGPARPAGHWQLFQPPRVDTLVVSPIAGLRQYFSGGSHDAQDRSERGRPDVAAWRKYSHGANIASGAEACADGTASCYRGSKDASGRSDPRAGRQHSPRQGTHRPDGLCS